MYNLKRVTPQPKTPVASPAPIPKAAPNQNIYTPPPPKSTPPPITGGKQDKKPADAKNAFKGTDNASKGADTSKGADNTSKGADKTYEKKVYSESEIRSNLIGYLKIDEELWDHIEEGSHIRFIKKGSGPITERYKSGGFVKCHFVNKDTSAKCLMLETKPGGKPSDFGYRSFPIAYENISEIWKKYPRGSYTEVHMIVASLSQKKDQIKRLEERVSTLERLLNSVVDKLIKK